MPLPKVGEIVDGYSYSGGDPNSQKSWKWVGDGSQAAAQLQGDAPGEPLTPGSESRTRVILGLGPSIEAQRQMYASEGWKPGTPNPTGKNPLTSDWGASMLEAIPFDGGAAARLAGGEDYQRYTQAAKTFESAFLPILSGAAVTPSEAQRMLRAAVPQFGDSPSILAQKAKQRAMMINGAADLAGRPRPFPKTGTLDLGESEKPKATNAGAKPEGWTAGLPAAQRKAALLYKGATGKAGSKANPFVPASLAEFQKIPPGSYFIDDDGTVLPKR